jgi:aquaporin NIP
MKKYYSEAIGTFAMMFCGCGAMTVNEITGGSITHVGVAITWGFICDEYDLRFWWYFWGTF